MDQLVNFYVVCCKMLSISLYSDGAARGSVSRQLTTTFALAFMSQFTTGCSVVVSFFAERHYTSIYLLKPTSHYQSHGCVLRTTVPKCVLKAII